MGSQSKYYWDIDSACPVYGYHIGRSVWSTVHNEVTIKKNEKGKNLNKLCTSIL